MLRIKQLPTADSVAAGKKAVFNLPLGLRYHVIWLRFGNAAGSSGSPQENDLFDLVDDIVVKVNGKPQRTHTAKQLNQINGVNGAAYLEKTTGIISEATYCHYVPIFFAQPWRKTPDEVSALALRANGISQFQVEVNLRAQNSEDPPADNDDLFLDGWYEYDYDNRDIGVIQKFMRVDYSAVGSSLDIQTLEKRDLIEAIHLFPTDDDTPRFVDRVKFTRNGEEIRDEITYLQNRSSLQARELVPDTTGTPRYDLVFDYDDPILGGLSTQENGRPLNEMTLKVHWNADASGVMQAIIARTGPPE